jgi:cytochrome c553
MKKIILGFLLFLVLAYACNPSAPKEEQVSFSHLTDTAILEGKALMVNNCYICHSPSAPEMETRVAPPMVAIKAHYLDKYPTKDAFIQAMIAFLNEPTKENALLPGAVARFGVMPKQQYSQDLVEKIAAYMFDYKIEEPLWFASHWKEKQGLHWVQSGKEDTFNKGPQTVEEKGMAMVLATKSLLGQNLMGSIQAKGTLAALSFCNVQAFPLTDSMSTHFQANIKRVSDKNRSPYNVANEEEKQYIVQFSEEIKAGLESKPIVKESNGMVHFYYPIITNTMCLQCHGKEITPDVLAKIKQIYPKDLAIGYDENQVRGIWKIEFPAQ